MLSSCVVSAGIQATSWVGEKGYPQISDTTCAALRSHANCRATSSSPPTADSTISPEGTRSTGSEHIKKSSILPVLSLTSTKKKNLFYAEVARQKSQRDRRRTAA